VEHPESVTVTERVGEDETILELRVSPDDMGKVIGRQAVSPKKYRGAFAFGGPASGQKSYSRFHRL
jgi:hypothetical protein